MDHLELQHQVKKRIELIFTCFKSIIETPGKDMIYVQINDETTERREHISHLSLEFL